MLRIQLRTENVFKQLFYKLLTGCLRQIFKETLLHNSLGFWSMNYLYYDRF